ncbi:uncharacterized protein BJX67DRAFT_183473 [Aspergillus lucknowensis]|uniref:GPI inositol-deacylase winged helix domain-containing protein n=1 Tax=Aspergillus lucknowensis TaxID=176173 RepID=A0ABR4LLX3_9EURO
MFLLANLYLRTLEGRGNPNAIKTALEGLSRRNRASWQSNKPRALSQAYDHAMERVMRQKTDLCALARKVLSWIVCAKIPLRTAEIQHALAANTGECELEKDSIPTIDDMISVCAGLVTVDKKTDIIRLVHYTTQEYFDIARDRWFPQAMDDITAACVTYLSYDRFETGFCVTQRGFDQRLRMNALYSYASRYWGHHARDAAPDSLISRFLSSSPKVEASSQALWAMQGRLADHSRGQQDMLQGAFGCTFWTNMGFG